MKPGFYPDQLPDDIINDPSRDAEVRTFNALKKGMPPDYHVFYSCEWLDTRSNPVPSRDGECDFIIAHEDLGILFIEVKGGEIRRDGETGEWYRITSGGDKKIKDPMKQAKTSKHVTLQLMQEHWPEEEKMPFMRLRHGVVLPHSSKPTTLDYLGAALPLSMFAFSEDMDDLPAKMITMLLEKEGAFGNKFGKPGRVGISLLCKFFANSFDFKSTLSSVLDAYDKRISDRTEEQKKILEFTSSHNRALILGGAGTGKTYLAHEKVLDFAQQGLKTLLLCYNAPITQVSARDLGDIPNLSVKTFHALCREAAATPLEQGVVSDEEWYEKILPTALEKALSEDKAPLFDAIVIDEAQDLKATWLETLLLCLKDLEKGRIFVFADDNQNLYENVHNLPKALECEAHTLTKNVRNTDRIFSFAQNFYLGVTSYSSTFNGPEVRYESMNPNNLGKDLHKFLLKLHDVEGVRWENIAVLSMQNRRNSKVYNEISTLSSRAGEEKQEGKFIFDSVWRFKGLESQVVIVVDVDKQAENRTLQYVAATRARTLLVFCGPAEFSERYSSLFNPSISSSNS